MGGKLSWINDHIQRRVPCDQRSYGGGDNPSEHLLAPDLSYDVTAGSVARYPFLHMGLLPVSANNEVIQLALVYS